MTETPKCPYCGAEMEVTHAFVNDATAAHKLVYTCFCRDCGVYTPKRSTPKEALSAALHRAEPENRPLTLGEVQECCEKGIGYMPLWVEFRNTPNVSRWMPINLPDTVFSGETVSIYLKSIGDKYNAMWRCWHWKPTPEQMAAEKWEE